MYYGALKNCDIANGVGVRVTLFVSGCTNGCEGCFQPETWDFKYGKPFTEDTADEIVGMLMPDYVRGFTLLGGEPMEPKNQPDVLALLTRIKEDCPTKDIWLFSGFTYDEELTVPGAYPNTEYTSAILDLVDVLVDGRFILAKKDFRLRFRGSSNQRIIDMRETRLKGEIVLWNGN